MALSQKSCAFLVAVVAAVCIQLYQAHDFPGRCSCPKTMLLKHVRGNMSDFQVIEKQPGCDKVEFIVTATDSINSTEKYCINTDGRLAKAFLKCWERINKDESRKRECIDKKRRSE